MIKSSLLLLIIIALVAADHKYVISDTNMAIGTCQTDADCSIYGQIYPNLNISTVFCNPVITRCQDFEGNVLDPATKTVCPDITLTYVLYPAMTTTVGAIPLNYVDGMIVVNITSSDGSYNGFLRLYLTLSANFSISAGFYQEQFVNSPTSTFYFRGLVPGTYQIQYFDQIGCFNKIAPLVIAQADDGSYIPKSLSYDGESQYLTFHTTYTLDSTGRGARLVLASPWNSGFIRGSSFTSASVGYRVPFVHIFDMGGYILDTVVGLDLFTDGGGVGGATFPIRCRFSSLYASTLEATRTSGFVTFQMGIGFATRACSSCPLKFISDPANGIYEGYTAFPITLDLNVPSLTDISPYDVTPMFFRLNGIYTNTEFMYSDTLQYSPPANLSIHPKITMIDPSYVSSETGDPQFESVNYFCKKQANESAAYMIVYIDYTPFTLFGSCSPRFNLFEVVRNASNSRLILQEVTPSQESSQCATIRPAIVYKPGFYCAMISENFLEGRYLRVILQTCFQVGRASASLIQVDTSFDPATQVPHNTTTAFGGYSSTVVATFIANLPRAIVLQRGMEMRVVLRKFSSDPSLNQILLDAGSNEINVFNDDLGSLDMSLYYFVTRYGDFYLYTLNANIYAEDWFFDVERVGSADVTNEIVSVSLIIFNVTTTLLYNDNTSLPNLFMLGSEQYECSNFVPFTMLESTSLRTRIVIENAICPDQRSKAWAYTEGDFPMHSQEVYSPTYNPATDKLSYLNTWVNVDPLSAGYGDNLGRGLNMVLFAAPTNVLIQVWSMDARGMIATAQGRATSLVSSAFTTISFLPQVPTCLTNNTQGVTVEYVLNHNIPGTIEYYEPADFTAKENYNPNAPLFNIPTDCALLNTMNKFDVFLMCNVAVTLSPPSNCTGCTHLPKEYEKANSDPNNNPRKLRTVVDEEIWTVVVWTPTNYTNADVPNRTVYCRTTSLITTFVPVMLQKTTSQLTRLPCFGSDCFYTTIDVVVDPRYSATYDSIATFLTNPVMTPYTGVGSNPKTFRVQLGLTYNMTLYVPLSGLFCPVDITYTATAAGPVIVLVRTTPPFCHAGEETTAGSGYTVIYMRYTDPNPAIVGTTKKVCLYWPGRRGPSFSAADELPFAFSAPVNPIQPTLLPYLSDFGFDNQFTDIVAGDHQLMIYDRCADNGCLSCKSTLPFSFTLLDSNLLYAYKTFTVDTADNEGGIVIELTNFETPQCHGFGSVYRWNFTIYDNIGPTGIGYPPYEILFKKPFTNEIYKSYGGCAVTFENALPDPTPFGDFQVSLGNSFYFEIDTGLEGLGESGNYTLIVQSCASKCVKTFATYVDFVQPLFVSLASAGSGCSYKQATITTTVFGGTKETGSNATTVTIPGSDLTYDLNYDYCWITPFNPVGPCIHTFLPASVYAGYYQLTITDSKLCNATANITVGSPAPITVTNIRSNAVCQSSNSTTVTFNVTGPVGRKYYILENITSIQTGTVISADFVGTFNQSILFHLMDSENCISPVAVSFRLSDPGPVPLNVTVVDSCSSIASGQITVSSPERITCRWSSAGFALPELQSCTLKNVLPNVFLVLTATTDIGCVATQEITVGLKPLIVIHQVERTTVGYFDQTPCIDNMTLQITGGESGPPFRILFVLNPTPNETIIETGLYSDANGTVFVSGVCRSYEYRFRAVELDATCSSSEFSSTDPDFQVGSGTVSILGLPHVAFIGTLCVSKSIGGEAYGTFHYSSVWIILMITTIACGLLFSMWFIDKIRNYNMHKEMGDFKSPQNSKQTKTYNFYK